MASPTQLNAISSIANGQGLAVNANVLAAITKFQNTNIIKFVANIFNNVNTSSYGYANIQANISNVAAIVSNLTLGVTQGQFLLDMYPSNISTVCSTSYPFYSNTLASFSGVVRAQAQAPFGNGMAGFANAFNNVQGTIASNFDTASTINLLQNQTYGNTGIASSGVTDFVTGGIGQHAGLLGNVISNWGTFYDINNINLFTDPYVFGQNLLNQDLGSYGSLSDQLSATGLDITNLSAIPNSTSTTLQQQTTQSVTTPIGSVVLPTIANVTVTNTVTGNNPSVVTAIYQTVTGANLSAILSATGFSVVNNSATTLADYLVFNKVVDPSLLPQLSKIGIVDFPSFSSYLNARVGQGSFTSWSNLATFLLKIQVPTLNYTTSNSGTAVLLPSTISTLGPASGANTGSGPFKNPVILDYLGAVSGTPYTQLLNVINTNYSSLPTTSLLTAITALDALVVSFINYYNAIVFHGSPPTLSSITSAVNNINSILNSLPSSPALTACQTAYYAILHKLNSEVVGLQNIGVTFGSSPVALTSSAPGLVYAASSDTYSIGTSEFLANLITYDSYGDTIRAAVAENINTQLLASAGINTNNDPNPAMIINQANSKNIPISTYLSQNK